MTRVLPPFHLHRPSSVPEVLELLGADCLPYSGGTELLLAMKAGLLRPEALVDLKAVPELRGVQAAGEGVRIGAGATHVEVARDAVVRQRFPVLADVARRVGNARVRRQGTVGGNLCFAEPKSDLAALLIALDADVELARSGSTRTVAVADLVEGPYWTVREEDELLTQVHIPAVAPGVYVKYQTMERPTVGVALVRGREGYRLVVCASCEVPTLFRLESLDVDADELAARIDPIADLTGSEEYKRHVTGVYIRRAIARFRQEHDRD